MKVCYINFTLENPRDRITIRGLRENGVDVVEVTDNVPGLGKYFRLARTFLARKKECDVVMVGYAGAALVPLVRLLTRKKIFYNALSSFYDSMTVSRAGGAHTLKTAWLFVVDWLAFCLATRTFLECESQKDLVAKVYHIRPERLSVHVVGADDTEFHPDPSVQKLPHFTAVFRGMFLPEAGADVVIRAAKELEGSGINVRMIGRGLLLPEIQKLAAELVPANLELITDRLPTDELRRKMLECHVSIGQVADHPRVHTTIPHKAFESMAMGLPYLTGANKGVLEILEEDETCFTIPPGDYRALAKKLVELRDRPAELARVAENARSLSTNAFVPKALGRAVLDEIESVARSAAHKVGFFFVGADRFKMLERVAHGELPDSALRGANFFAEHGFAVETVCTEGLERRLPRVVRAFVPMALAHLLLVPRLLRYDTIIASDGFLPSLVVSLVSRTKWVFVAINSSALIRRHTAHPLRRFVLRACWKRCARIVCLSERQKEDMVQFGIDKEKMSVVHFGIDTEYFDGIAAGEGEVVMSIGKDLGRDYRTLLAAARASGLPFEIIASRKNIPEDVDIPENVTIRYNLPLEEMRAAYARAKMVVVASLPEDADQGTDCSGQTVILEALAMGRPVIATDRAWLREYLEEGTHYRSVQTGDAPSLARAIRELWESREARDRIASAGRETVRAEYTSRRFAEGLRSVIESIHE